jgi:hypothetical protein
MKIDFFDNERNLISQALSMWANWIETGDISLSAIDASNMKKPFNALDSYQYEIIVRLRALSANILNENYTLKE